METDQPNIIYPQETKIVNFIWLEQRVKALETGREQVWSQLRVIQDALHEVTEEPAKMKIEKREEIAEIERLTDKFNQNCITKYNEMLTELCKVQDQHEILRNQAEIATTNIKLLHARLDRTNDQLSDLISGIREWAWKGVKYLPRKWQLFFKCLEDLVKGVKK